MGSGVLGSGTLPDQGRELRHEGSRVDSRGVGGTADGGRAQNGLEVVASRRTLGFEGVVLLLFFRGGHGGLDAQLQFGLGGAIKLFVDGGIAGIQKNMAAGTVRVALEDDGVIGGDAKQLVQLD